MDFWGALLGAGALGAIITQWLNHRWGRVAAREDYERAVLREQVTARAAERERMRDHVRDVFAKYCAACQYYLTACVTQAGDEQLSEAHWALAQAEGHLHLVAAPSVLSAVTAHGVEMAGGITTFNTRAAWLPLGSMPIHVHESGGDYCSEPYEIRTRPGSEAWPALIGAMQVQLRSMLPTGDSQHGCN